MGGRSEEVRVQALIVVDMQNGFLRAGNLASEDCALVLPAVVEEVEAALAAGQHVIFTADTHEVDDREFEIFPTHCVRGTEEAELVAELQGYLGREGVHVIPKRRYSAMFETELEGLLHGEGVLAVTVDGGSAVGLASLDPTAGPPGSAGFGVLVEDAWHGRGVGTALLRRVAELAVERGLLELTGRARADDIGVTRLLRRAGLRPSAEITDGEVRLRAALPSVCREPVVPAPGPR